MKSQHQGYILITATMIIFAIAVLAAVSLLYFAIAATKNNRALERSNQAKGLANACAELGVQKLITTSSYTGTTNTTIGSGACSYTITQPTGSTSLIAATATVGTIVRKVQVTMTRSPLAITLWQEVP